MTSDLLQLAHTHRQNYWPAGVIAICERCTRMRVCVCARMCVCVCVCARVRVIMCVWMSDPCIASLRPRLRAMTPRHLTVVKHKITKTSRDHGLGGP